MFSTLPTNLRQFPERIIGVNDIAEHEESMDIDAPQSTKPPLLSLDDLDDLQPGEILRAAECKARLSNGHISSHVPR